MKENVKFSKGDEIIALRASSKPEHQQRKLGEVLIVNNVLYCFACGRQYLSFSGLATLPGNFQCRGCPVVLTNGCLELTDGYLFCHVEDAEETLQKALVVEDYDTAIAIREYYKSLKPV